jgi:protein translocase SecG subunit
MLGFFAVIQFLSAVLLIICILLQTTKSESSSSGGGMGWGIIGGKSSASFKTQWGLEAHLNRITTYTAIAFMSTSFVTALLRFRM